jgi:hypothetical protein
VIDVRFEGWPVVPLRLSRCERLDRQRVDAVVEEVGEGGVEEALAGEALSLSSYLSKCL